jgi:hypothetical protein
MAALDGASGGANSAFDPLREAWRSRNTAGQCFNIVW